VQVTGQRNRAGYGINTYSFTQTQRACDCLEQLADRGYRRFEVMLVPGHFWPSLDGDAGRRQVQSLLVSKSLQILSLNQPNLDVNLSSVVPEMREHSCRVIASAIELAAAWNAKGVVVNPGKCNWFP
jgi:L-ribulose-5-phosphate 3-epimerase